MAISIRGLGKRFGETVALADVNLDVPAGSVLALLGPNGSGKTTTINILSTLLRADAGTAIVDGHDVAAAPQRVRSVIGVTGQFSALDELLTGRENMLLMADLHHIDRRVAAERIQGLLAEFDLLDAAEKPASTYSGGMKRRLDLAMTLLGEPRVIFLDEPTTGLDPRSRRRLWERIRELVSGGVTVLLTTQYLDEADALAERIVLLDHGRVVAEGTAAELKALVPGGHVQVHLADGTTESIPSDGTIGSLRALLADHTFPDDGRVTVVQPGLDDVFLELTEVVG